MKLIDRSILASLLLASTTWVSLGAAAVPASYKGTPYKGTAQAIPGRIEFENVDLGGFGVAYDVDHHENTASGKDYRPGEDIPQISRTNTGEFMDKRPDMSLYPSAAKPQEHYIGWAHAGDWVKLTVDVKQAGTYKVSSTFASDPDEIRFDMHFNDGTLPGVIELEGTKDFHVWKEYRDFATVELEAGLQVLQFSLEIEHLQYDYLELTLVGGQAGGGSAGGNGAGGADASGGAAGSVLAGAAGAISAAGSAGASTGTGGLSSAGASSGVAAGGTAGAAPAPTDTGGDSAGCSLASGTQSRSLPASFIAFGVALGVLRQRRRTGKNPALR